MTFETWDEHFAIGLPEARAVFTTRRGGFSSGAYATLNLGKLTDDLPDAVQRNRELMAGRLGIRLAWIRQVHGADVRRIRSASDAAAGAELPLADGQATAVPGIGLVVLVADCLPIAIAGGGAVAMLHAGWRGLAAGIIEEGVRAVRELGGAGPLAAAIGPGAGRCCYEVGSEVHEAFAAHGDYAGNGHNLDLKAIAAAQLRRAGVQDVHDLGLCTICADRSLLFSHRADGGVTGRQAGIAWLI
ncbi:MAG: laccase domain-containing protein [Solirubrobacterales bacterium]|nr:laccase domain-containing protein [Solirubrobacterales bacterium]MBV9797394.1 laccase domain-containing protein [Solirubrobacterales bacterium]